eukprot:788505-Rhodomonas_salina.1
MQQHDTKLNPDHHQLPLPSAQPPPPPLHSYTISSPMSATPVTPSSATCGTELACATCGTELAYVTCGTEL